MKVVAISEFMNFLKQNDLVIVSASEFQANKQVELSVLRSRLLKKKAVTVSQIVQAQLLPYSTKQGVRHWMEKNLKEGVHWYQEVKGQKRIMILIEALKNYIE